jgi:nanoRNase/pAp phosphatase (c-di-AMP/oligoRNAs hydrolase)
VKPGFHARRLVKLLKEKGRSLSPLTILTHDHPDPDALASAWALSLLAQGLGKIRSRIVYGGAIGRAENRMMAERLIVPARPLRKGELAGVPHLALIDTQPPFKNNRCPPRRIPDLIVDHHPRHADTQADLVLIDEAVGAALNTPPVSDQTAMRSNTERISSWKMTMTATMKTAKKPWNRRTVMYMPERKATV